MPGCISSFRQLMALAILVAGIAVGIELTQAKQPQAEEVTLPLGSVFEILAQEGGPGTQYAWVLSLDRTFLQAGRGRVLRTRFSQPGKYFLSAEVVPARPTGGPAGGKSIRRSFAITVKEDLPADAPAATVTTVPPHVSGMIALGETQRLIKIVPPPGALTALTLDADVNVDENGDGVLDNDPSSADTFLGSDGLPLFLWMTGDPPKTFALTGQQQGGAPFSQQFTASVGDGIPIPVPGEEPALVTGGIEYTEREDGTVHLKIREAIPTTTPVLPIWDFGDGAQSLLLEPLHSYGSSGTYIVRVRLKDLRNGIDIRDLRESITVKGAVTPSPETPIPPKEEPEPSSGRTSRIVILVLKIIIGLVIAGLIGAAAAFAFAKLRKGKSLADRLEEADKKMVIGKEGVVDGGAVAPMSLPEIIDEAPKRTATPSSAPSTPPPPPAAGPVPSWLQSTPPAAKAPVAPAPAPKVPTPAAAPAPKIEAAPKETPKPAPAPVSSPDGPLPAWLQSNPSPASPIPVKAPAPISFAAAPDTKPQPAPASPAPETPKPIAPAPKEPIPVPAPAAPAPAPVAPAPAPKPAPAVPAIPIAPTKPATVPPAEKIPDNPPSSAPVKDPTPTAHIAPKTPSTASISNQQAATSPADGKILTDKERERRRLKRQRYRQNKAKREVEAMQSETPAPQAPIKPEQRPDDAPVAFIRAESIEKQPQPNKPTKPTEPTEPQKPNPPPQESK